MSGLIRVLTLLVSAVAGQGVSMRPIAATSTPVKPPAIVIGFTGGFVGPKNLVHAEVQVVARLHQDYSSDVYAEAFRNYREGKAHKTILRLLDTDHDGRLTAEEKQNARIVIYGHSWGAAESIVLARQLARDGIPVLLTIQVDS